MPFDGLETWASCQILKIGVGHAPGMPGTFSPPSRISDPDMHHGTCVTHVPWCMLGSLISGFLWSRWRGKHSRHSRRMRNPQFYVSGKRPMNPEHQQPWYSQRKTAMFLAFFIINSNSKNLINFREWHLYFYRKWFDTRRVKIPYEAYLLLRIEEDTRLSQQKEWQGSTYPKFLIALLPKFCIFQNRWYRFEKKTLTKSICRLAVLLAPDCWIIGYVEPWTSRWNGPNWGLGYFSFLSKVALQHDWHGLSLL